MSADLIRSTAERARGAVLRLSVTDRCNFRCRYCMPAAGTPLVARSELPSLERLLAAVAALAEVRPIARVKLTGGEPLARRGLPLLVRRLCSLGGVAEVSATTNGALLAPLADELAAAGLARVNVSLDTLDEARFAELTRGGRLADTLAGIDAAGRAGLTPVKLNSVLLADAWKSDVPALLDLAAGRRLELRLIELMQTGTETGWARGRLVVAAEVREWLRRRCGEPTAVAGSGVARRERFAWNGSEVTVGWITPISHPFCRGCSRFRLDARGRLRRCLMDPRPFDLLGELESRGVGLGERLVAYLAAKRPPARMELSSPMAAIGG